LNALFVFEYKHDDYNLLMQDMARQLGVGVVADTLVFPSQVADGYYRVLNLPNGLQANLIHCTFKCNWYLHRTRSEKEYYTLRFDEFTSPNGLVLSVDQQQQTDQCNARMLVYLTSSLFDFSYLGTAGTKARGINILLKPEFMQQYLGLTNVHDMLGNYIALKAQSHTMVPPDSVYEGLMNDILGQEGGQPFGDLYLLNRLQLMIERFFARLQEMAAQKPLGIKLNHADINRIMRAEHILTHDFSVKPPSIAQLAATSAMSVSSFKSNFKLVYGKPVYAHYQENRLAKARELLANGQYSVKETAAAVAYENASNFIVAFKKQFGILPGQLLHN
jgi:AraC-like DNA-binding protein